MQTKLYPNKNVARMIARNLKVAYPDYRYVVGPASDKPSPGNDVAGYFCIRLFQGRDFFKFA